LKRIFVKDARKRIGQLNNTQAQTQTHKTQNSKQHSETAKQRNSETAKYKPQHKIPNTTTNKGFNGIQELKDDPYFANIDWSQLQAREITPPFVPDAMQVNAEVSKLF